MITNTSAYQAVSIDGFTILHHQSHIIITQAKSYGYLLEKEILFSCEMGKSFLQKNLFNALSEVEGLPSTLALSVSARSRDLIGEELHLFASKSRPIHFCTDKDFAIHYGISDPCPVKLTIIEAFDNEKDFDKSINDGENMAFGFWDVEKDEVCSSFLWLSPMQTKMCFADFAKHGISFGSLFLKLKIEEV